MSFRNATFKAAIVLVPSYTAAFLTEQMVYVVPMLAATSFFAGTVDLNQTATRRRVDDEAEYQEEGSSEMISDTIEASDGQ